MPSKRKSTSSNASSARPPKVPRVEANLLPEAPANESPFDDSRQLSPTASPREVSEDEEDGAQKPSSDTIPNEDASFLKVKRNRGVYEVCVAKGRNYRSLKQVILNENYDCYQPSLPTYVNIEAPMLLKPPKKYCDITGFPANYRDPKTKLIYCSKEAFGKIRQLSERAVHELLALRDAHDKLR